MMKQECEKEATESQLTDAIMSGQTSAALSAQTYQQVLQQTSGAGNLTPQLQFFQAPSNSAAASLSLPWMMPHYQMMVLPQGVPQSLFASNVLTLQDSHILVAPLADGNNGQPADDSLIQAATAEGLVRQVKDSEKRPSGTSPVQPRQSATAGLAGDAHVSAVHGGNMMMVGQQVITDGTAFNAHMANTSSVENILGRHRQVQGEIAKPDVPKPPKKPLTPYMLFSKAIWPQVKAANSHLSSVCEIGAVVGGLWRELDPVEKQRYNEQFTKDKERYDAELRLYLSTTGLHASDLVKPKQKRKDIRDKSSRPTSSTTLNAPGQHLVQSMMGATGLDVQRQTAAATAAAALPNLAQDWTGQAVQQFANQQLLAQMGLAGQTLYANSDGSISVDGGLVAFHPQSLQVVPGTSGTVVSGAGGQIATIYSDQRLGGLVQSSASKLDAATSLSEDPSRAWPQSQSNLVLYQASAAASAEQVKSERSQAAIKATSVGNKAPGDGAMNGPMSQDHQEQQYYSIDQLGQLVKCENDTNRKNQLEAELLHLRSALSEKNNEVQSLNLKLEEAYRIIDRYKQQFSELALSQPTTLGAGGSSDRQVADGVATDGATVATAPTTTVGSTSG